MWRGTVRGVATTVALLALAMPGGAHAAGWLNAADTLLAPDSDASAPVVAVDPAKDVFGVWLQRSAVTAAVCPPGGSFAATPLTGPGASLPDLAVDAAGDAIAVWVEGDAVHGALRPAGGTSRRRPSRRIRRAMPSSRS